LGIRELQQGVEDKARALSTLLARLDIAARECACVGDDTPDVPMMRKARLAVAVADAHPSAAAAAHFVTSARGGRGAVRETCDLLLEARNPATSG